MEQIQLTRKGNHFKSIVGFGLSFLLLFYTVHKSELNISDLQISPHQWLYFSIAILAFIFSVWLQSARAKYIWTDSTHTRKDIDTYSGFLIGNLYNCIIPANAGEAVRAYHFSQKHNITFTRSLSAIITEKWLDTLVFITYVVFLFFTRAFISHTVSISILITSCVIFVLWLLFLLMLKSNQLKKMMWKPFFFIARKPSIFFYKLYYNTILNMRTLKQKGALGIYIMVGLVSFAINVIHFMCIMRVVGIQGPLFSIYTGILISAGSMILVFIPSAPSSLGVLHYGMYLILLYASEVYEITPQQIDLKKFALFGVYTHLSFFIPEVTLGLIALIKERKWIFNSRKA